MNTIKGYFDDLDFSACALGEHSLKGDELTVPVAGGLIYKGPHPLSEEKTAKDCRLVFKGVTFSKRVLEGKTYYLGPFLAGHGPTRAYDFAGEGPSGAEIKWEVEAREFLLEL